MKKLFLTVAVLMMAVNCHAEEFVCVTEFPFDIDQEPYLAVCPQEELIQGLDKEKGVVNLFFYKTDCVFFNLNEAKKNVKEGLEKLVEQGVVFIPCEIK